MSITKSDFVDNFASAITHGITMFSSKLTIDETDIRFSSNELNLKLTKLDTGFFNLHLGSELRLSNTLIENIKASKQAVLGAFSQSQVFIRDVDIIGNEAVSLDGSTMLF